MRKSTEKTYPAKVSFGLVVFIFLIFFGPLVPDIVKGGINGETLRITLFLSIVFVFILHLFFNTRYTIDGEKLKIQCGIFSYKPIDIDQIKTISKTQNIISSPAPSFDRIIIKYGKHSEMIVSPKDKIQFAKDLVAINPLIKNKLINNEPYPVG